jgi:pimeloyl-ACP methyl ester carboxylesterase
MYFTVPVDGGVLVGSEAGAGTAVLILHGGPASDDTEALASLLPAGLRTIRYQQRGIEPSTTSEPYDVETHVADAIAVLDARGIDQAWVIGHSWGAQLAFHLAVGHPERLIGVIGVDALGAVGDGGWGELDTTIVARLEQHSPEAAAKAQELDQRAMAGNATDTEALEMFRLVWPYYFAAPEAALPLPEVSISVPLYAGVVASVQEHFERGTLEQGLPTFSKPFVLIHGEQDPLPIEASRRTAALVPHAILESIQHAGHMPWLEQPEAFRAAIGRALSSA